MPLDHFLHCRFSLSWKTLFLIYNASKQYAHNVRCEKGALFVPKLVQIVIERESRAREKKNIFHTYLYLV